MFDASKIWPLEVSAKLFQCQFLGYGWTNQSIHYMVFCRQKIPNKDASIAFWLQKGHATGKPLSQLAIREDANFFVKIGQKSYFLPIKIQKLTLTLE